MKTPILEPSEKEAIADQISRMLFDMLHARRSAAIKQGLAARKAEMEKAKSNSLKK